MEQVETRPYRADSLFDLREHRLGEASECAHFSDLGQALAALSASDEELCTVPSLVIPFQDRIDEAMHAVKNFFRLELDGGNTERFSEFALARFGAMSFLSEIDRGALVALLRAEADKFFALRPHAPESRELFLLPLDELHTAAWHIDYYNPLQETFQCIRTISGIDRTHFVRRGEYDYEHFCKVRHELLAELPKVKEAHHFTVRFAQLKREMAGIVGKNYGHVADTGDILCKGAETMHCSPPGVGKRLVFTMCARFL